jgi:hypothetical protein
MQKNRVAAAVLALTALAGTAAALSTTGAHAATAPHSSATTFVLTAHQTGIAMVDVGAKGQSAGDSMLFTETLKDAKGRLVGSDQVACVQSFGGHMLCNGVLVLSHRGTLTVSGLGSQSGPFRLAVTGGTSGYSGVRGQLTIAGKPNGDSALTVSLVG